MGYEDHAPAQRRGSMTQTEEKERRASIKAIMADTTLSPMARRRSIQHLMDGRRNSMSGGGSVHSGHSSCAGSSCGDTPETFDSSLDAQGSGASNLYGYGEVNNGYGDGGNPYGYGDEPSPYPSHHHECAPGVVRGPDGSYSFSNEQTKRNEQTRPHCSHYERNCTIVAPCCGGVFGCRICHDDCPVQPPKINNGGRRYHRSASLPSSFTSMGGEGGGGHDDDTHHNIDRFAIREVICRECFTRQSSKA